jgi:hypothetical protein
MPNVNGILDALKSIETEVSAISLSLNRIEAVSWAIVDREKDHEDLASLAAVEAARAGEGIERLERALISLKRADG